MMTLQAFNNDPEFKKEMLRRAKQHRIQDQYIRGEYGRENGVFKGCSVGCCIRDLKDLRGIEADYNDHEELASALGVPEFIVHLQESIFENLPEPLNTEWTERLMDAIPVGVDLSPVLPRFLLKNLDRLPETDRADVVASIKQVRDVLQDWADNGTVNVGAAESAESAALSARSAAMSARSAAESAALAAAMSARSAAMSARSASWSAARSAEWSASWSAESAARSAEWSAEWSAESAARSAESAARSAEWSAARSAESVARSAEWSAEWSASWEQIANDLIECIRDIGDNYGN